MAIIEPFKGIVYSKERIKDISSVMAPPYDVMTEDDVNRYESKNEYNIVRLIRSKDLSMDGRIIDRYTRAAELLKRWLEIGVLVRDREPSIYLYEHIFKVEGKNYRRTGFLSAVRLENYSSGKVLPHENTFPAPIEDRFRLTVATKANLCSIFSIFSDKEGNVMELLEGELERGMIYTVVDEDGGQHTISRISDKDIIERVKKLMWEKKFLIADGHHRYETALRYRDFIRSKIAPSENPIPADYVLMYLSPMESSGLVILPIYRLIKFTRQMNSGSIIKRSGRYFDIKKLNSRDEAIDFLNKASSNSFKGFALEFDDGVYLFSLKSPEIMRDFNQENYSSARLLLNVSILHQLFIRHVIGMSQEEAEKNIRYSSSIKELMEYKNKEGGDVLVLLGPTTIAEIRAVAENNERMPQKSTYFYPKLLSGLVIRTLEE